MSDEPYPEPTGPPIVCVTGDPVVRRRAERYARDRQAVLLGFASLDALRVPQRPLVFLLDLRADRALAGVRELKSAFPDVPLVAVIAVPDAELWREAEAQGADAVLTHGTLHRRLDEALADFARRRRGGRRVRVAEERDLAGRVGLVSRLPDELDEPAAVYHVGRRVCVVADRCPHAGGVLSEGELDGSTVTCPLHGSQFDVCSGERLRGPADDPIRVFDAVVADGAVVVELDEG